jgi:hypothetical protein
LSSGQPLFSGKVLHTESAGLRGRERAAKAKPAPGNSDWGIHNAEQFSQEECEEIGQDVAEEKEVLSTGWAGTEQSFLKKWFFTLTPGSKENEIIMNNFIEEISSDLLKAIIGIEGGDEVVRERHFHGCLWFKYELENLFVLKKMFEDAGFKAKEGKKAVYLHITEIRNWPKAVKYTIKGSAFLELRD